MTGSTRRTAPTRPGCWSGRELGPSVTRGGHLVIPYETTSEAAIRLPLDSLGLDFDEFVFLDLGCGKGKPLLVAATYPFRRLVGVDISPACIAVARRNLARYGPERIDPARVELRVGDAEDVEFPAEPLVLYLYNPFPGAVLERVVAPAGGQPAGAAQARGARVREPSCARRRHQVRPLGAGPHHRRADAGGGGGPARARARRRLPPAALTPRPPTCYPEAGLGQTGD